MAAGRDAASRSAWREAYELFKQADASERLEAGDLAMWAESAWWLGRLDECIAIRERAFADLLSAGEKRAAAELAIALANDHFQKLAHSIGAGWFNKAERLLEEEPDCAEKGLLTMMHAMSALRMGDNETSLSYAEATLETGMRFANRDLQAFGLLLKGSALLGLGRVEEGLSLLDEATVAAVSGELKPLSTGIIYCIAISRTTHIADFARAGEWTDASKRWCDRQSIAGFPGICRVHRAEIMRLRGAWADAEQEARRALVELQSFNLEYAAEGFYELGEVRLRMGDLDGAADAFRQAHELGRDPQPGLGVLWLAQGKTEAARNAIRRSLEDPSRDRLERMRLLPGAVEIDLALGDLSAARESVEEMESIAEVYASKAFTATAMCARGALELAEGNEKDAVRSLLQSAKLWREADLPYEAARARLMLGLALRADGNEDEAMLEIGAAKTTFEKLGAVLDLRRAQELLGEEVAEGVPKAAVPAQRVTKTFMFTDIVGSTNLAQAMGEEAWGNVLGWHDETLRKLVTAHYGEEVKQLGDGFFVAFDDPTEAVECAVEIQRQLREHGRSAGFAPQVRIGLHAAEATRKGNDYEGMAVHEAARIGATAGAGEILASEEVVKAARLRWPTGPVYPVELKGVENPVNVALIEPSDG